MNKPSPHYVKALEDSKEIHKGKQFTGKFLRPHAPFIKEIIDRLGCRTVLDYGCGKGQQYEWVIPSTGQTIEQFWGVEVTKFDPAWPPFAAEPQGTFDLVICTQVLGAIPVTDRGWVIDRLYGLADKALYVSERLGEARKIVGDNALRGADWNVREWQFALMRNKTLDPDYCPGIEVTFCSRIINDEGAKITSHHRQDEDGFWHRVQWPDGVRAMNHKWAP